MDKTYIVTMRVTADVGIDPLDIEQTIYDACENVPFSIDIDSVYPQSSHR